MLENVKRIFCLGGLCALSLTASSVGNKASAQTPQVQQAQVSASQKQNQFNYLFTEGVKFRVLGQYAQAVNMFKGCLSLNEGSAAVRFELATIYSTANSPQEAIKFMEKAVALEPDEIDYQRFLGQLYLQTKDYTKAQEVYKQLVKLDPENIDNKYTLSKIATQAEDYSTAISTLRQLQKDQSNIPDFAITIHEVYAKEGKVDKAINELKQLIREYPNRSEFEGMLADYYFQIGQNKKALQAYNHILNQNPKDGFVLFSLTKYYLKEICVSKFLNNMASLRFRLQIHRPTVFHRCRLKLLYYLTLRRHSSLRVFNSLC